ncbi:CLUMA_CG019351, isoform A [Clunio marinus]|uniref:CLUMA_CG019351, isoform A n=1 Tax=Clunio marinus TaxID=568069 RepID=A0A1J1J0S9_9DIPT|nr:CLUMA_CG019351, isoform A [Clunio marinus]
MPHLVKSTNVGKNVKENMSKAVTNRSHVNFIFKSIYLRKEKPQNEIKSLIAFNTSAAKVFPREHHMKDRFALKSVHRTISQHEI